jgi:hypothetical protein
MFEHVRVMLSGPGTMRGVIQPIVALVLGILHGLRDHRMGRRPYMAELVHGIAGTRWQCVKKALHEIWVPLVVALLASMVFQYVIRSRINLLYALLYALIFVALPYFLARGLANRGAARRSASASKYG